MGLARFILKDPYFPASTGEEVEGWISKMHGVIDWMIHPNGEVTCEYDRHLISDEVIEAALGGLGFNLEHIFDNPYAKGLGS